MQQRERVLLASFGRTKTRGRSTADRTRRETQRARAERGRERVTRGQRRGWEERGGGSEAAELPTGWGAMRAKLSNYCLTWEQLYLAETPWVVEEKRGKGREREKLGPVPALPSFSLPPPSCRLILLRSSGSRRHLAPPRPPPPIEPR